MRRLAPLLLVCTSACVSGSDGTGATWEGCSSDLDCKDGRVCRDGACADPEGTGGAGPDTDVARVLFRLARAAGSSGDLYIQDVSEEREYAWFTLLKGTSGEYSTPFLPTCAACFCGACGSCGGLCGAAMPVVRKLEPGDAVEVRWDGTVFPVDSTCPGDGPCYHALSASGAYRARFCWSRSATGVGPGHRLNEPRCAEQGFTYNPGSTAVIVGYTITEGA